MNASNEGNTVRFVYATNSGGRRVTVAYQYDDANQAIRVAAAQCSKRDQFVKKIGRDISFGRLTAKGGTSIPFSTMGGFTYAHVAKYVTDNVDNLL